MSPQSGVKIGEVSTRSDAATHHQPNGDEAATRIPSISFRKQHGELAKFDVISDPGSSDSRFFLQKCQLPPHEEFHPVEMFVADAVASKEGQDGGDASRGYQSVLQALRRRDDPPTLRKVLLALRTAGKGSTLHQITSGSSRHAHLVHLLFRLDPFATPAALQQTPSEELIAKELEMLKPIRDFSLADSHLHLLLALVSANSTFLSPGLNALWRMAHFDLDEAPPERMSRVHAAIATMLRLCPKGNSELFPIMAANFPFRTKPVGVLTWYAKQCLYILDYLPTIHGPVLELLLDKCLEIDVEIRINGVGEVSIDNSFENDAERNDDEVEEGVFQLDLHDSDADKSSKDNVEEEVDEMAEKLDSLMLLAFEHIEHVSLRRSDAVRDLYAMISPVFDSSILTTHRSKFVQFVVLFLCGLDRTTVYDTDLYREFAAKLIDIIMDPYRATVTRQSGACYLASFISRAQYVCPETVCEAISALLRWAEAYLDSPNGYAARHASDLHEQCELHSLFYTVCQAAFYIMCFRGVDAMKYYRSAKEYHSKSDAHADDAGSECPFADLEHVNIEPERWNRICCHELHPLRFCLESVRGEFLHVATIFQLLDVRLLGKLRSDDSKLSTGRSRQTKAAVICTAATLAKRRMKGGVGGLGRGSNPLDSFFPFDPYLLRHSFRYIEPMYKNWEGSIDDDESIGSDSDELADDASQSDGSVSGSDVEEEEEDGSKATHMPESIDSNKFLQGTSHTSNTAIASQSTKSGYRYGSQDGPLSKQAPREAWGNILKRSRAPSIENGSW